MNIYEHRNGNYDWLIYIWRLSSSLVFRSNSWIIWTYKL